MATFQRSAILEWTGDVVHGAGASEEACTVSAVLRATVPISVTARRAA